MTKKSGFFILDGADVIGMIDSEVMPNLKNLLLRSDWIHSVHPDKSGRRSE
ncbi:MAG: hypothetical protein Q8O43_02510 [Dehalococcoidia bacterium]|nr:hypothetical protein [Dehalococcoidia bacterium]